jgi:DNA-binding MarR family transcriptional regulator
MKRAIPKRRLAALLYEFLDAIYLFQKKEEGLFGASWQDIFLLKRLADRGELMVGEAAAELRLPLFAASRAITRLVEAGLVEKARRKGDGRVVRVRATAAGRALLKRVEDYQCDLINGNIGVLEGAEIESMVAAIGKLRSLLDI